MEEKYIDLLLEKCTRLNKSNSLLINYSIEIQDFIDKLVKKVNDLGITDIYLDKFDIEKEHELLKTLTKEEILKEKTFDKSIWDTYAKKNACFLIFETEYPGIMDDVDPELLGLSAKIKRESHPIYRKMVDKCELSWCIAAYPGELWSKSIFKESNSYELLKEAIFRMCMINKDNPIKEWTNHLNNQGKIIKYINNLKIKKLHYKNNLGTNLELTLPENYLYSSALDTDVIVNMPSYEIFASPVWNKTNGIVYASKPLMYNGGLIEDFWIKFENGKVIEYDAKKGKNLLKSIIETDEHSSYLGECALVENNSPIARENIIYGTTLIDENASCHLALGAGFAECIKDGLTMTEEELLNNGINVSKNHVDFMIGTPDLKIEAITKDNKIIPIFTNGNFDNEIIKESNKC